MFKNKKLMILFLVIVGFAVVLTGCAAQDTAENGEEAAQEPAQESAEEPVSSPSVAVDAETLTEAMSADGTWIIIVQQDLTVDQELVLEGEFSEDGELDRKLALYEQDEDRNVTARYTLTAPSITVRSPNTRFQSGTFVGDVYVEAENFTLRDFTVDGNVYFENEAAKTSFNFENGSEITGTLE